jgi:hypothetical protein
MHLPASLGQLLLLDFVPLPQVLLHGDQSEYCKNK